MNGIQPECLLGILLVEQCLAEHGLRCTITSITDDAPGRLPHSLHKAGLAFDVRVWDMPTRAERETWGQRFCDALGPEWDVVVKDDHIHCEFDPEKGGDN